MTPSPRPGLASLLAVALAGLSCAPVLAQTAPGPDASVPAGSGPVAILGHEAAQPTASGRIAVNLAAGSGNQEANVASIAIGGVALAGASVVQTRDDAALPIDGASASAASTAAPHAAITGDALAGATGMIAVNVTAGTDNQLANLAGIAIGATAATSLQLAQTRAPTTPTTNDPQPVASGAVAELSATAFQDASGLVQVNLVGGDRNAASNSFALAIAGQGTP